MINGNTKGRKNMRAMYKLPPDGMNKTDSNSPIILQNITFNLFSHYLTTRRNKGGGFLSKARYSGARSAFVHMYHMSGETIPAEFSIEISQFMSGMKRTVTSQTLRVNKVWTKGRNL